MAYVRPAATDFNRWEKRYGCTGWGYNDMLPVMKRMEDIDDAIPMSPYRNRGGMMHVQYAYDRNERKELCDLFEEAAQARGHPYREDYNGEKQIGQSNTTIHVQRTALECCQWLPTTSIGSIKSAYINRSAVYANID